MGRKQEVGIRAALTQEALNAAPEKKLSRRETVRSKVPVVTAKRKMVAAKEREQECWESKSHGP